MSARPECGCSMAYWRRPVLISGSVWFPSCGLTGDRLGHDVYHIPAIGSWVGTQRTHQHDDNTQWETPQTSISFPCGIAMISHSDPSFSSLVILHNPRFLWLRFLACFR